MNIDQYPKKRMAAGVLVRDAAQRLLIVKPTYRPDWLVPGGAVEYDESPRVACMREITEELGLHLAVGRLLCVDYRPATAQMSESVQFIFDGGVLDAHQIEQITLPPDELERFVFLPPDEALPLLNIHLHRRMAHALVALRDGGTLYLEDGRIPE
jgi:8-oxo-dGTP diphosphatase